MNQEIEVTIKLCDRMNPSLGYQIEITKWNETIYRSSVHPVSGDSLTYAMAVEVAGMYVK